MNDFHEKINSLGEEFILGVYKLTKGLPKEELYGISSQLRRAALSVMLNYTEGRARRSDNSYGNFLHIVYGSLKESEYLLKICVKLDYVSQEHVTDLLKIADQLGAMLFKLKVDHKK